MARLILNLNALRILERAKGVYGFGKAGTFVAQFPSTCGRLVPGFACRKVPNIRGRLVSTDGDMRGRWVGIYETCFWSGQMLCLAGYSTTPVRSLALDGRYVTRWLDGMSVSGSVAGRHAYGRLDGCYVRQGVGG
jgi:hypothetical protein